MSAALASPRQIRPAAAGLITGLVGLLVPQIEGAGCDVSRKWAAIAATWAAKPAAIAVGALSSETMTVESH